MEFATDGLIVNKLKFKENSVIVTLFTESKGLLKGVYQGGVYKKNAYKLQLGNLVKAIWHARLEDHLGYFKLELKSSYIPIVFNNIEKLLVINSVCELINSFLPERDPIPELYQLTIQLLANIKLDTFLFGYLKWELALLKCLGYGLDIHTCGVCNTQHPTKYVSPKTGVAVCEQIGDPYKSKLLVIPKCLHLDYTTPITKQDILDSLTLTGYFIRQISSHYHKNRAFSRNLLLKSFL